MSCWLFFLILYARGGDIPTECLNYVDDPGYSQVVELPRYIIEEDIDSNGDGYWAERA